MTKLRIVLTIAIVSTLGTAVSAQSTRSFDNFDTASGVRIHKSPAPSQSTVWSARDTVAPAKKGRRARIPKSSALGEVTPFTARTSSVRTTVPGRASMGAFTTGNPEFDAYIADSSRRYNIDPLLIYSQMHQESSFKQRAISHKGASGLMQLMPATARRFGVTEIFNPRQNIDAGVRYMRWLLDTFGQDLELALAGYNAGEGAVIKYGRTVPPYRETREYVRRIMARYASISDPRYVRTVPKVTAEQALRYEQAEARPLSAYEARTIAVRLPDGSMRLVND